MDWGPDALLDTIKVFGSMGIKTVGAGKDGEEARQPAIIERNGIRIAILAYCSFYEMDRLQGLVRPAWQQCGVRTYYE